MTGKPVWEGCRTEEAPLEEFVDGQSGDQGSDQEEHVGAEAVLPFRA